MDLHGHGNPVARIELGYLLYDDELELSDSILNTNTFINYSSIQNLVLSNVNDYTHAQLLRGEKSLGTLLSNYSFPSVLIKVFLTPELMPITLAEDISL